MALQNIIRDSARADVRGAETHRLSAISNIENALSEHEFTPDQQKRLQRLLRLLKESATQNNERKLMVIQYNVIPTLVGLGLVTP